MEISITEEIYNPLIGRKEIQAIITHLGEVTPTRDVVRSKVAAQLNMDKNQVVIQKILGNFGEPQSKVTAHCYDDPNEVLAIEPKYLLKRNLIIKENDKEG